MSGIYTVYRAGDMFLNIVSIAIFVYCILSLFRPNFRAYFWLEDFIRPFLMPFRRLSIRVMRYFNAPIDFTCWFALIGLRIVRYAWYILCRLIMRGMMRL